MLLLCNSKISHRGRAAAAFISLLFAIVLAGCLGPWAKNSADKQVYPIVAAKQKKALGAERAFTIEPTTSTLTLQVLAKAARSSDMLSTAGLTLSLSDALALAVDNNREYQRRKERLYQSALALTSARHEFSPIFTGLVTGRATREPVDGGVERFGEATTNFAVTKLLATGARVTVGLSSNLLRYHTGDPRESATGLFNASVVQPLLQGGGYGVTMENLIQAERDVIYAVRDYARYQKSFTIDRINEYYRLLQLRDTTQNQFQSYQRLTRLRERAEAFLQAGRMPAYQVDQARQDEISAQNDWLSARTDYALALDQFKLNLGIPADISVQPDPDELVRLRKTGPVELGYDLETAQKTALRQRLDFMTARDQAEDAFRRIDVVKNSLLPALDPYPMGYHDRTRFLRPEHRSLVFDRAGNARPTTWVNGRVVGTWLSRADVEPRLELFEALDSAEAEALRREESRQKEFLAGGQANAKDT
jgi:outer membrane protein TolC